MKWLQRIASVEMLRQIVYMQRLCKLTSEIMKIGEEFLKKQLRSTAGCRMQIAQD